MRATYALVVMAPLLNLAAAAETIRFEGCKPGTLPAGWTVTMTHKGEPSDWQIVRDESAPSPPYALGQLSRGKAAGRFPLAIWNGSTIRDGDLSVAFKTLAGTVDQAAGIVWRYQDQDNYYIVRANALENNVVLYKVERGVRSSIAPKGMPSRAYGVKRQIPKGQWNTLRVVFKDRLFKVFLNGDPVFEAEDGAFLNAGRTGLWTKADSVTYFDDFSVSGN